MKDFQNVISHALKKTRRGKNPSLPYRGEQNPKKALRKALEDFTKERVSSTILWTNNAIEYCDWDKVRQLANKLGCRTDDLPQKSIRVSDSLAIAIQERIGVATRQNILTFYKHALKYSWL